MVKLSINSKWFGKVFARAKTPEPKLTGRTATPEEIAKRFPKGNKVFFDS